MALLAIPLALQAATLPTQTSLAVSASSVSAGSVVTLTASVTASGSPVTKGEITFCDATAIYCENSAVLAVVEITTAGSASYAYIPGIGTHSYKAVFTATATQSSSFSSAQELTVNGQHPTTTNIAASGVAGNYTLVGTVSSISSNPPTLGGSVSFIDTTSGGAVLDTAALAPPVLTQTFAASPAVTTGYHPALIAIGDYNGDGIPDLASANRDSNSVSIRLGKGDGTFYQAVPDILVGNGPWAIATADLNGDGKLDLAVANQNDNDVTILLGDGTGNFTQKGSPVLVQDYPQAIKIADFNGDGILDLAVANSASSTVSILLGKGDGTFITPGALLATGTYPFFLATADFNGDGKMDLAVVNHGTFTPGVVNHDINMVGIWLGQGNGTFVQAAGSPVPAGSAPGNGPSDCGIVSGDFNGDGKPDFAVANFNANAVYVFLGNGDGTFSAAPGSPDAEGGPDPYAMALGDFNMDGNADLAVVNYPYPPLGTSGNGTVTLMLGDGKGGFTLSPNAPSPVGLHAYDVETADFNGDGMPDLAVPNLQNSDISIFLNSVLQTATATAAGVTVPGSGTHEVEASYPGSTFFAPSVSGVTPLTGSQATTALNISASTLQQLVTMPVTFTAQISSAGAGPIAGTVSFFDGGALLGVAPVDVSGQAIFTTTSLSDGTHTITANYSGSANYLPSSTAGGIAVTISDFQLKLASGGVYPVVPGAKIVYNIQVSPLVASTFLYSVSLTAGGLPPGASYPFAPMPLAAGSGQATVVLTIQTAKTIARAPGEPAGPFRRGSSLALGLLLPLFGLAPMRKRLRSHAGVAGAVLLAAVGICAAAGLSGCSNAGFFGQPKVSYTLSVTGTSGTLQHSISAPLTIQ